MNRWKRVCCPHRHILHYLRLHRVYYVMSDGSKDIRFCDKCLLVSERERV